MSGGVTHDAEDANELQFGDFNFNEVQSLTNDEMYFLLTRRNKAGITNEQFEQTFAYVERVATTKSQSDLEILTMELDEKLRTLELQRAFDGKHTKLHPFEISCLANFIKDDDSSAEEILSLIPSMSRFPPDQVELAIGIVVEAKDRATGGL